MRKKGWLIIGLAAATLAVGTVALIMVAPKAECALGAYYAKKGNFFAAAKWYRRAAEKGVPEAQFRFGICYQEGDGAEEDPGEAIKWFKKAAEQDHAEAQCHLAKCYINGDGVEKDIKEALKWCRKSAAQQYAPAQTMLGWCYEFGEGVEEDGTKAVKWYRKAAEQGYDKAQYNLGVCYTKGDGVEEDPKEAVKWFRMAAEQELPEAQCSLGVCYAKGDGVEKNPDEAAKWFRKSAEQGYAPAQTMLGWCYEFGDGVEKNLVEAVKWFRKAAAQEYAPAQFMLGECYFWGKGVESDFLIATKWFQRAAEQGYDKEHPWKEFKFYASQMYMMAKYAKEKFYARSALIIMDEGYKNDPRTELVIRCCKEFIPNVEYGTLEVPPGEASLNERMRASHFDAFTNQYPDVDVIITMVGIPCDFANCKVIKDCQANRGPELLMIGNAETRGLTKLIANGTISALITIRFGAQFNDALPPSSMEDTFCVRYEIVTKDNLDEYKAVIGLGM